jgi:hypothetical protein
MIELLSHIPYSRVQKSKYDPRFTMVLRSVAGLLQTGVADTRFEDSLSGWRQS